MTVSIIHSRSASGYPVALPQDMGDLSPSGTSDVLDLYLSHDGAAKISNCKFYILPYSAGVYLGAGTAQDDYELVLGWGDDSQPATSGGGLYISMDHAGGFPTNSYQVFYTGSGSTLATAIQLSANAISTGAAVAGEIPPLGEAHIRLRLDVPAGYIGTGRGYVDTLMYYTSTS